MKSTDKKIMDANQQSHRSPDKEEFDFDFDFDESDELNQSKDAFDKLDEHDFDLHESEDLAPVQKAGTPAADPDVSISQQEESEIQNRRVNEIPVTLEFVLGQMKLTIEDLKNLAPEVILHVEGGTTANLMIMCSGQTLGHGELVSVNGQLGIRVTSWSR